MRRLAQRERLRQADRFDERARPFLDQKIEGIVEAPLGIVVCCDHGEADVEVLGRGTIPETDVYSTACAIQNLWLTARAEGLGIGWVSFYQPADLQALLRIPERVTPMAYLCVGWPDERPVRPGLEASGWSARTDLSAVVMHERWEERPEATPIALRRQQQRPADDEAAPRPDRAAAIAVRDRADQLVRPAGSLGALDAALERWASITGGPPSPTLRAGVLVAAADHGHTARGTSLFPSEVSSQVAAAAARGETAVAVLARQGGHALRVVDIGLDADAPSGAIDRKVRRATADVLEGPAMTPAEHAQAMRAGEELVDDLLASERIDLLVPARSASATRPRRRSSEPRSSACRSTSSSVVARAPTRPGSTANAPSSMPRCVATGAPSTSGIRTRSSPPSADSSSPCSAARSRRRRGAVCRCSWMDSRRASRPSPRCAGSLGRGVPDRRPPIGRTGARSGAHGARPGATPGSATAPRRGLRRAARAPAPAVGRRPACRHGDVRRGGRERRALHHAGSGR